mgnify:FL=1
MRFSLFSQFSLWHIKIPYDLPPERKSRLILPGFLGYSFGHEKF